MSDLAVHINIFTVSVPMVYCNRQGKSQLFRIDPVDEKILPKIMLTSRAG